MSMYRKLVALSLAVATATALGCEDQNQLLEPELLDGATVLAAAPRGGGPPPGKGETDAGGNNLSTPTIMIGAGFTGITCTNGVSDLVYPTGDPLTGYEVEGYYYVQGTHAWQADCMTAGSATATAEWGDNLAGDAKLKAGKPIRVELGLFDDTGVVMEGFQVLKLEPSKLDRESLYGTLATLGSDGVTYSATAQNLPARVYDPTVTFSVKNLGTGIFAVPEGTSPTAEINATGKVVYGYNLRVTTPGEYEIAFVIPKVDITGVDAGSYVTDPVGPDRVTLTITVITGGGGGGQGGR